MDNILEMKAISKSFSEVQVLKNVDFSVQRGEVRALIGANGAGKSTLMKILGGVYKPTSGEIFINGEKVNFLSPHEAIAGGIGIIYQELSLVPTMTVFENVYLNREMTQNGLLEKKKMREDYERLAADMRFAIPGGVKVSSLGIANQQLVEIMKAISIDAGIIVMDEPTTSLTDTEKEKLFRTIKSLKERGKTVIYISHILRELFEVSDSITIMRDGEIAGNFPITEITQMEVAGLVMNRSRAAVSEEAAAGASRDLSGAETLLRAEHLTKPGVLSDISFSLRAGEILGLAGLLGAGRTEICRALFGDLKLSGGQIIFEGKRRRFRLPKDAIKAGICLIPEDRKNHGLILKHAIYQNSTLVCMGELRRLGMLSKKRRLRYTGEQVKQLDIKIADPRNKVSTLSGGNQQKVVVSKWFGGDYKLYIFDEPTKGIDVGAKEDVFRLVRQLADGGAAVIFVSSDLEEVLKVSDRILVLARGRVVKEFEREEFDLQTVMAYSMDISESPVAADKTEG